MPPPFWTVHHICIVVCDLDRSVAFYESVGIGPWYDFPSLATFEDIEGVERANFLALRYRFAQLANLQLQLCQPGAGDTPQRRFLDTNGEGVFHIGFSTDDLDTSRGAAEALGLGRLLSGCLPGRGGFAYFDTANKGAGVTLQIRAMKPA